MQLPNLLADLLANVLPLLAQPDGPPAHRLRLRRLTVTGILTGAVGYVIAVFTGRGGAGQAVADAQRTAETTVTGAKAEAATLLKQAELDAQTQLGKRRAAFEKETEAARNEVAEKERRLTKREDLLDKNKSKPSPARKKTWACATPSSRPSSTPSPPSATKPTRSSPSAAPSSSSTPSA